MIRSSRKSGSLEDDMARTRSVGELMGGNAACPPDALVELCDRHISITPKWSGSGVLHESASRTDTSTNRCEI